MIRAHQQDTKAWQALPDNLLQDVSNGTGTASNNGE